MQLRGEPRSSCTALKGPFPCLLPLCGLLSDFWFPGLAVGPPFRELGLDCAQLIAVPASRLGDRDGTTAFLISEEGSAPSQVGAMGHCCGCCHYLCPGNVWGLSAREQKKIKIETRFPCCVSSPFWRAYVFPPRPVSWSLCLSLSLVPVSRFEATVSPYRGYWRKKWETFC